MRIVKAIRNVAAVGLVVVGAGVATPVRAGFCEAPWIGLDDQDYAGACAPGGEDACGYFRSICDYYCFSQYTGNLCWNDFYLCQEHNVGSESAPEYCLTEGYCDCFYQL
jgi:hypothetical protein